MHVRPLLCEGSTVLFDRSNVSVNVRPYADCAGRPTKCGFSHMCVCVCCEWLSCGSSLRVILILLSSRGGGRIISSCVPKRIVGGLKSLWSVSTCGLSILVFVSGGFACGLFRSYTGWIISSEGSSSTKTWSRWSILFWSTSSVIGMFESNISVSSTLSLSG